MRQKCERCCQPNCASSHTLQCFVLFHLLLDTLCADRRSTYTSRKCNLDKRSSSSRECVSSHRVNAAPSADLRPYLPYPQRRRAHKNCLISLHRARPASQPSSAASARRSACASFKRLANICALYRHSSSKAPKVCVRGKCECEPFSACCKTHGVKYKYIYLCRGVLLARSQRLFI